MDDTYLQFNFDHIWPTFNGDRNNIICLSDRDISIILSSLRYASWPTRIVDSDNRRLRDTGRLSDLELWFTYIEQLEDILMTNCADGLMSIAAAIQALADKPCCGTGGPGTPGGTGTGGAGAGGQTPNDPVEENTPPADFVAAGYDWNEFKEYQCNVFTWLVDSIGTDLATMTTIQAAGLGVTAVLPILGALLLTPIPGAGLFAIAAILIAIAAYGWVTISEMSTAWEDAKADILCILYNELDPTAGITAAIAAFDDAFALVSSDPVKQAYAHQVMGYMLNADGVNKAFTLDTSRTYPAGDCQGCNPSYLPIEFRLANNGTLVSGSMLAPETGYSEFVAEGTVPNVWDNIAFSLTAGGTTPFYMMAMEIQTGSIDDLDAINDVGGYVHLSPYLNTLHYIREVNFRMAGSGTLRVRIRVSQAPF